MSDAIVLPTDPRFQDVTGQRFERLTVIAYAGKVGRSLRWRCRCDCGNETIIHRGKLGITVSCGCLQRETISAIRKTHGMSGTPEYYAWSAMIGRCTNPKNNRFKRYGARGISVCERWLNSFDAFYADMGDRPSEKHSLDRKNNDLGYSPENCRWAIDDEQARNKHNNVFLEFDGKRMIIPEWSRLTGISIWTIRNRLKKGWSIEKTLTTPPNTATVGTTAGKFKIALEPLE